MAGFEVSTEAESEGRYPFTYIGELGIAHARPFLKIGVIFHLLVYWVATLGCNKTDQRLEAPVGSDWHEDHDATGSSDIPKLDQVRDTSVGANEDDVT